MLNKIGWVGSILLSLCGAPEAYRAMTAWKYEISVPFIVMWGLGELLVLVPVVLEIRKPYLIFNYSANLFFITLILTRILSDSMP